MSRIVTIRPHYRPSLMAYHKLSARGFSAWITINDEPLQVYEDSITDTTCTAWIPSTVGQPFSVWWKDDSKARIATSGHVFVDGHDVASAIIRPGRTRPVERTGAKSNDETVASKDDPSLRDIGTIKIEISRVKLGDEVPFKGYEVQDRGPVHERAKKLGAHCTSYDPGARALSSRTVAISTAPYYPNEPGPYVTFAFYYRSDDFLRAKGVIGNNGHKKRSFTTDENGAIIISDNELCDDSSNSPGKKRARTGTESVSSMAPPKTVKAPTVMGHKNPPEQLPGMDGDDIEMESDGLGFGAPSLLQSEPEREVEVVVDESQTQVDTQIGFGAPTVLLMDQEQHPADPVELRT